MSQLGYDINLKADELNRHRRGHKEIGKKFLKDFCRKTATIMNDFALRIGPEIPIFSASFEEAIDAVSKLVSLTRTDKYIGHEQQIQIVKNSLISLNEKLVQNMPKLEYMMIEVNKIPRMEKELNAARNHLENKLMELKNKLIYCNSLTNDLINRIF